LGATVSFNYHGVFVLSHDFVEFFEPYVVAISWIAVADDPDQLVLLFGFAQERLELGQHASWVMVLTAEHGPVAWVAG
jgi:hypothetical protein